MNTFDQRVLVLEDDPEDRILTEEEFQEDPGGFTLHFVSQLKEFERELLKGGYDTIISDFYLDEGNDAIKALELRNEHLPNVPFIIFSGYIGEERAVDLIKKGVDDFLPKEKRSVLPHLIPKIIQEKKERKIAEDREQLYLNIFQGTGDAIIIFDTGGVIQEMNPSAERIYGMMKKDMLGKGIDQLRSNSKKGSLLEHIERKIRKSDKFHFRDTHINSIGEMIEVEMRGNPIQFKEKEHYLVIIQEITEQKKYEEQLKTFRNIVSRTNDGILLLELKPDGERVIEYSNRGFRKMTGFTNKDLRESQLEKVLDTSFTQPGKEEITHALDHDQEYHGEVLMKTKEARTICTYASMSKFFEREDGTVQYLLILKDVTDQKVYEEQNRDLIMKIQEEERKRIAHDLHDGLGQTLTALSMHLNVLDGEKEIPSALKGLMERAITETRSITHNLAPNSLKEFGLVKAIEEMVSNIQKTEPELEIKVESNIEGMRFWDHVEAAIYRIVQEVINNTIKHANANLLEIQITRIMDSTLRILVKDNGVGFPEENGSGMGINSIRHRVASLRGICDIRSGKNQGTTIRIDIPLKTLQDHDKIVIGR